MPSVKIPLSHLTEGVSTRPSPQRAVGSLALAQNTMMRKVRGLETRVGTSLVKTDQADYSLNVTNPTQSKFFHWIDRDDDEKFLVVLDPANAGNARFEAFTLIVRGTGAGTATNEKAGQKMPLTVTNHPTGGQNPLAYISAAGTTSVPRRFRALTVTDTTLLANKDVAVGFSGAAITYTTAAPANIRDVTNANNKASWNSLPQPPTGTAAAGVVVSNFIYFTRDDDLGWPAGWYRASSTTQPPWYTRIRTEGANSQIDWTKWPIRVSFDGTNFVAAFPDWPDRYSGDTFTNPGPQLASGPSAPHKIQDMCYFQGRLWFGGYEFIDSSQGGDVFNLWLNSYVGVTDTDPVNVGLQSDAVTTIDFMIPFDGGIVTLTRGQRQFEVRSQGAMTPSTVSILPTGSYSTVSYCAPAKLGNQLYFCGEQNGAMLIYEYRFQQDRGSNIADVATADIEGFIPSQATTIRSSPTNDMLFVLSNGRPKSIFVCQMKWENNGQLSQRAWQEWTFTEDVQDCQVFGSTLYIIFKRNSKLYLETVNIDLPADDDDGLVPVTVNGYSGSGDMGYSIRLDSRASYQGVYNAGANLTTWTIPYEDASLNKVVLGQMWDCNYEFPVGTPRTQRRKGRILTLASAGGLLTVIAGAGVTTITAPGNYAKNGNGTNAPCWIGRSFTMTARLNEQFVRQDGAEMPEVGLVQFKRLTLRVVDTGSVKVQVTPAGRDAITHEYIQQFVGQTTLGSGLDFRDYDEFNMVVLGSAYNTQIDIINDSPYPCRVIGGEFRASFVPSRKDPTRA